MKRVAIILSVLMAVAPCFQVQAQTVVTVEQGADKKGMNEAAQTTASADQPKQVSFNLEEGHHITLRNRFGPIVVTGTGGDTLEASVSEIKRGAAPYSFRISTTRGKDKVMIATSVTTSEPSGRKETKAAGVGVSQSSSTVSSTKQSAPPPSKATPPAQTAPPSKPQKTEPPRPRTPPPGRPGPPPSPARPAAPTPRSPVSERTPSMESLRGVGEIRLEVKLPRNARIDLIDSRRYAVFNSSGTPSYLTNTRNDVIVTNIETPVSIISSGDVQATRVGGLEAKTRASNVSVKEVAGSVNISTVTGAVIVKEAYGDVRVVSISGTISIECARGRAEAGTTNGSITLMSIGGDLDASTAGGTISYTGVIRDGGRYRLKSMSGPVRMFIQKEPPGFLASLSSYKGQIMSEFELKTELSANTATPDLPSTQGQPVRRMTGRFGDGDARITLDSFSGAVQLGRAPSEVWKNCR